jgi:hypothetical protein
MGDSLSLTVTVNRPDDTEFEFEMAGPPDMERLGRMVTQGLEANGVKPGEWSSLVVTIVPPNAPSVRQRPKLSVV